MSKYNVSKMVDERVLNYRFTITSTSDPALAKLRDSVKKHNQQQELRETAGLEPHYLRVRVRGRGPIVKGKQNKYSVKLDNATYFDVYVQRDTDKMHEYRKRVATKKAQGFIAKSVNQIAQLMKPVAVGA